MDVPGESASINRMDRDDAGNNVGSYECLTQVNISDYS